MKKITHSVFFKLNFSSGSQKEKDFLNTSYEILSKIPRVNEFNVLKEISPKNNFDFGFTMIFNTEKDYESYNNHIDHTNYVTEIWIPHVSDFQEIDFVEL